MKSKRSLHYEAFYGVPANAGDDPLVERLHPRHADFRHRGSAYYKIFEFDPDTPKIFSYIAEAISCLCLRSFNDGSTNFNDAVTPLSGRGKARSIDVTLKWLGTNRGWPLQDNTGCILILSTVVEGQLQRWQHAFQ